MRIRSLLLVLCCCYLAPPGKAKTDRYRTVLRDDPATSIVVAWHQYDGPHAKIYYGPTDHGTDWQAYPESKDADEKEHAKGLFNHFARLKNLQPDTEYFFVIRDENSVSKRMYFRTAPADPNTRLSIVAGGDSRNNREARREANKMVAKLRPNFVMFGGDMTGGDTDLEWLEWMEDWQLTIAEDGYLAPIIPTRGNHEASNKTLKDLFDVRNGDVYYALNFGGDLLRVYTLNSMIAVAGDQRDWLESDLRDHPNTIWKTAQYHHTMRPHTRRKPEKNEQIIHWANLFLNYGVNLVVESDAHVVKTTYPIRPSNEAGAEEGFIRDDLNGTVYVGEGCWGAPLRANDDPKSWTRASGSFNQFKWIWVDQDKMEVRTVMTDGADAVAALPAGQQFRTPANIRLWNPPTGEVLLIHRRGARPHAQKGGDRLVTRGAPAVSPPTSRPVAEGTEVSWTVNNESDGYEYFILRSTDGGGSYLPVGRVNSKAQAATAYRYVDRQRVSNARYRIERAREGSRGPSLSAAPTLQATRPAPPPDRATLPDVPPVAGDFTAAAKTMSQGGKTMAKFVLTNPSPVSIELFDENMRRLKQQDHAMVKAGPNLKPMDTQGLPAGTYYLTVTAVEGVVVRYRVLVK